YTAVGQLEASSLQLGAQTIYRLTDPATGRTLCYIRSNDPKNVAFISRFIGVKGDLVTHPQLSLKAVIAPDISSVDPASVNRSVSAQVVPPSLLSNARAEQAPTASSGN